jgi:hypothetical protein
MPHLVRWNTELSPFGLAVIGPHVQEATDEEVKGKARALGLDFPVVKPSFTKNPAFGGIPHSMLFDQTGKCVYRGSPDGVDKLLRSSVGKAIVEGLATQPTSKPVTSLAASLKTGQSPMLVLQRAVALLKSKDATTVNEAKQLVDKLSEGGQKQFDKAEAMKADDPVSAYNLLQQLPTQYRGTPLGAKAAKVLAEIKKDKSVSAELRARPLLESIKKIDKSLEARAEVSGLSINHPKFLAAQAPVLQKLRRTLQTMNKSYPNARSTDEALAIGEKYGIVMKEKKKNPG